MITVAKFGGTSLANATQIKKVLAIIKADSSRKYIVVSAPGKQDKDDIKVTDMLIEWYRLHVLQKPTDDIFKKIKARFLEICYDLALDTEINLRAEFDVIEQQMKSGVSPGYISSRGEYLMAKILAAALKFKFVDATNLISFDRKGSYIPVEDDLEHLRHLHNKLQNESIVIPGFYGKGGPENDIVTFSRGGSDITGAIIARIVKADLYENWTDVSGLCSADPRIVNKPKRIGSVSHRELRELSYMGANVFHEEALFPLRGTKIPIKIKNTNRPKNPGTLIEEMPSILWDTNKHKNAGSIVGIAGRKGFISITIEKSMMNQEVGFTARVLRIFGDEKISIEHAPSGIDTMSVIVHESHFKNDQNRLHAIADLIKAHVDADRVTVKHKMAMICIVGQSMAHTPGVSARIFSALGRAKINIQMINQGSSEISIIVGVANEDSDTAIRAIYKTFRKRHMRPSRITQKA